MTVKNYLQPKYFIASISVLLVFFYTINTYTTLNKTEEMNEQLQTELIKIKEEYRILKLEKQKQNKEFKEYTLRKKAIRLSGVEIPENFKYKHIKKVFEECEKNNIPPRIAFRMIKAESNFRVNAKSSKGASGYFQIMPNTYRAYSKKLNIQKHNELANIEVGIYYLRTLYGAFRKEDKEDRWRLAILSYNYGIGRVGNNKQRFLGKSFDNYKYLNFITS